MWYILILASAVLIKLWMPVSNHRLYKLTGNLNLKAVRLNSANDCIATCATAAALVVRGIIKNLGEDCSFHDFRYEKGGQKTVQLYTSAPNTAVTKYLKTNRIF